MASLCRATSKFVESGLFPACLSELGGAEGAALRDWEQWGKKAGPETPTPNGREEGKVCELRGWRGGRGQHRQGRNLGSTENCASLAGI